VQFVLAGQPELDAILACPEIRQLRQRIAVRRGCGRSRVRRWGIMSPRASRRQGRMLGIVQSRGALSLVAILSRRSSARERRVRQCAAHGICRWSPVGWLARDP